MAWSDDEPVRGGFPDPSLLSLSGVDRMRAGFRQQMPPPPIHHLLGLTPVSASAAAVTFSMPSSPWLQTDAGVFFAGTAALVADAPLGGAVMGPLGPGEYVVTSDLSFNFLRPVGTSSGRLISRARPIEIGRSLGLAEGIVEDGFGHLVAHCTTRCFITKVETAALEGELPTVEAQTYETPDPYLRPIREGAVRPEVYDRMTFLEILKDRESSDAPPPPFVDLFGSKNYGGEEGRFWGEFPASPWFSSPAGTMYGGILAYVADTSMTGAVSTTLTTTESAATLDLKVQFIRPVWPDGRDLRAEAHVTHRGRSFAVTHATITNADGKVVVLATSSAAIRSGQGWSSFAVADEAEIPTP